MIAQVQKFGCLLLIELILLHRLIKEIDLEFLYLVLEVEGVRSGQVRRWHAALTRTA